MTEDDTVQYSLADAQIPWDEFVDICLARAHDNFLAFTRSVERGLQTFHTAGGLPDRKLKIATHDHLDLLSAAETEPDLCEDLLLTAKVWVVDPVATLGVGRQVAGGGIPETFDDGSLARSVGADDEGERRLELDRLGARWIERADSEDGELLDPGHDVL